MELTKLEFSILNAMADGSEPFSMIYADVVAEADTRVTIRNLAQEISSLIAQGFLGVCDGNNISADSLSEHYAALDQELDKGLRPFYYSEGEYFFEMTPKGREAWDAHEPAASQ